MAPWARKVSSSSFCRRYSRCRFSSSVSFSHSVFLVLLLQSSMTRSCAVIVQAESIQDGGEENKS